MTKKIILLALITSIVFFPCSNVVAAEGIQNTKCSKLNSSRIDNNKFYICAKKGNKLVWSYDSVKSKVAAAKAAADAAAKADVPSISATDGGLILLSEKCEDTFSSISAFTCRSSLYQVDINFERLKPSEIKEVSCIEIRWSNGIFPENSSCTKTSSKSFKVSLFKLESNKTYFFSSRFIYMDSSLGNMSQEEKIEIPALTAPKNDQISLHSTSITDINKKVEMKILLGRMNDSSQFKVECVDIGSTLRFFSASGNPPKLALIGAKITCEKLGPIDIGARGKKWDENYMVTIQNLSVGTWPVSFRWKYSENLYSEWSGEWKFFTGNLG